jgi:8-amino-7-oxononanoate synthase
VLRSPEGDALVHRLADLVVRVRTGTTGGSSPADRSAPVDPVNLIDPVSPIIPVIVGSEERALEASAALLAGGLWVPAIRPPTVPVGTSRLRVTLSALHTDDQVDRLVEALAPLRAGALVQAG